MNERQLEINMKFYRQPSQRDQRRHNMISRLAPGKKQHSLAQL